jgi:hypothetical protein
VGKKLIYHIYGRKGLRGILVFVFVFFVVVVIFIAGWNKKAAN